MMIPLLLCSVLALTIVLERALSLRHKKVIRPEIVAIIESINSHEDISLAQKVCEHHPGPFSNIVKFSLENRDLSQSELKEILTDQGRQEVSTLERGLLVLETIAGIAPLMGLLGTVLGMIKVFTVISEQGVGQASALAGGISEALITTVAGLSIGIPALVAYNYFTSRTEKLILEIEKFSLVLFMKLHRIREAMAQQQPDAFAPAYKTGSSGDG